MKTPKKPISLRLSETTIKQLSDIAKRHNISQAEVIAVLVHCYHSDVDIDDWEERFKIVQIS